MPRLTTASVRAKVASQHQARVVVARMKQAGWWSLGDEHSGNVLGDGPLDARIDFVEKIDEMYRRTWDRPVSAEELGAILSTPAWVESPNDRQWPMNQWVDTAAKYMDVRQSVVLMLPEDSLRDARRLWREHRNSGIQIGVPVPDGGFERTDESLQNFLDHIKAAFMFAQREAVEMVDAVDPDKVRFAKHAASLDHFGLYVFLLREYADRRVPRWKTIRFEGTKIGLINPDPGKGFSDSLRVRFRGSDNEYRWSVRAQKWRKSRRSPTKEAPPAKSRPLTSEERAFYRSSPSEMLTTLRSVSPSMLSVLDLRRELLPQEVLAYLASVKFEFVSKTAVDSDRIKLAALYQTEKHSMDKNAEMTHAASIALMKWLSVLAKRLGIAKHVYVVGGAVRNFLIDQPIKDIDMVVDSLALGGRKDSAWVAEQIARQIPAKSDIVTDALGVAKVLIRGSWVLDGHEMDGNDIEIVNARAETYEPGTGHKPTEVKPTSIEEDTYRREFTFNTLMWRLLDLAEGPEKAEVIDITGCGLRDLENREMRCPSDPDKTFGDDPTRIIRTIKFAFKYGFKLPPDVKAAAKRQAKGLKRIPAKTWSTLEKIVLGNPQYKKALVVMEDLGVIEVIKEMMQENKQFRRTLAGYASKRGVAFMFDLMDLGVGVGATMSFMDGSEQARFREITSAMDRDEALEFLAAVKKPGNAVKDDSFQPGLQAQHGITNREKGVFFPMVARVSRALLLDDPLLVKNTNKLKRLIADRVETEMIRQRRASDHVASLVQAWGPTMRVIAAKPTLDQMLSGMDLPEMRRDTSRAGNVRWLLRNMQINNGSHPDLKAAQEMLKNLARGKTAAVTGNGESVGLFLPLPKELADQFPSLGDDDDSPTHVTLFYGGGVPADRQDEYLETIKGVLSGFGPIKARLGDVDYFTHVEKQRRVAYVRVWFSRDMGSLRDRLRSAIEDAGFESKDSFPLAYNPHATLAYMDGLDSVYEGHVPSGDWVFDSIPLWGLPQKHEISLRGGSAIRVANSHLGLLPVMDPIFNVRECVKQLILLEDHLFHPRKRCPDCIKKHTLFAEALMEEAVTLDTKGEHPYLPKLADDIRSMGRAILTMPLGEAAQVARQIRKLMTNQLLGLRALDIERV